MHSYALVLLRYAQPYLFLLDTTQGGSVWRWRMRYVEVICVYMFASHLGPQARRPFSTSLPAVGSTTYSEAPTHFQLLHMPMSAMLSASPRCLKTLCMTSASTTNWWSSVCGIRQVRPCVLLHTIISDRTFGLGRMQGKRSSTASGH